ncbi:MAG: FAD-dependent oxidoreductase, partial [bacterium]
CEGACVYHHMEERPVTIALLQRYATDFAMKKKIQFFAPGKPTGKNVAVIGAGPSGLACAHELRVLGHAVTVFEAKNILGGLNTWGIAEYKMGKDVSLYEVQMILDLGVEVRENTPVTPEMLPKLEKVFDAIFVGIGLGETNALKIPGEDLPGVRDALSFIEEIKMKPLHTVDVGRRVAVIGAGNTAVDAATQAKRLGAEWVAMVYRRGEEDMSAYEYEYDLTKKDGVIFYFQTAPTRVIGNGAVAGLECVKMALGAPATAGRPDAKGKPSMTPVPGSEFTIPVDMVIKAVGQQKQVGFLSHVKGPKYFSGGDCANGGKEVVNATAEGKRAARGIHAFLGGKT